MKTDSPLVKCSANRRDKLSTHDSSWETCSEESDRNCGYDPDYESDEVQFVGKLKVPEKLRESVVQREFRSAELSFTKQKTKRSRSPSIRNLGHILEECDRGSVQELKDGAETIPLLELEEDKESVHLLEDSGESVKVLASTLLDGKKSVEGRLDFVPDVSSIKSRDNRGKLNFEEIFSAGSSDQEARNKCPLSSPEVETKLSLKKAEGVGLPGVDRSVTPRIKAKTNKNKLSLRKRKSKTNSEIESKIRKTESNLEDIIEGNNGEESEDMLVGTPQNSKDLTLSRKKRSAEKSRKNIAKQQSHIDTMEKESKGSDGSEDDLIIIDSLDSSSINNGNKSRKSKRKIEKNIALASGSNDCLKLCEYPVGKRDTVTVAIQDYATLEHDTFLNDIIIDFYTTYLVHNILPVEDKDTVHIFSTMFYKRLMQSPKKNAKKVAAYETDSSLKSDEKRHCRVAGWTKDVDLFSKDLIIIPICEHSHWYLLLVVKPGLITSPVRSDERTLKGEPFIIVLDSMGGTKDSAVRNIRQYLACEWKKKKCSSVGDGGVVVEEYQFSATQIKTVRPRKPEQENFSDCGIFLLHYVEKVFHSVAQFFWPSLPDLSDWFTIEEIGRKRGEIADLIKCLAREQNPGTVFNYPNIKFTAARKPRKRQKPIVYDEASSEEEDEGEVDARKKGKFASAVNSTRDRGSKSKLSRSGRHRSRRNRQETQKSTETANSSRKSTETVSSKADCEISGSISSSYKIPRKAQSFSSNSKATEVEAGTVLDQSDTSGTAEIAQRGEEGSKRNLVDSKASENTDSISSTKVSLNNSNCDNVNVPDSKTKNNSNSQSRNVKNSRKQKLDKSRAEQILADLIEFEQHGIEDEDVIEAKEALTNPKVLVSRPEASDPDGDSEIKVLKNSVCKVVGKTLKQLSPNVKCRREHKSRLPSDSPLFDSPTPHQESRKNIGSRSSVDSAETSGELFYAGGIKGGSHIVAHNDEDVRFVAKVPSIKKFKMVKNSRFEETESERIFERHMCATASEEDEDIFSQEND